MSLVKNEKIDKNKVELNFTLDAEAFSKAISDVYKKQVKKFNVPGFRKGHAPRNLIEKMYGADVFYLDAVNELFPDAYEAAVKEAGIEPVDRPEADIISANTTDGVVLKAVVTVKPEVKLGEYKGLKAEKAVNTVTDKAVDERVNAMADRNSRMVDKDENAVAENGDSANIDFEGFVDGVAFEGGKGEGFDLLLGSGQFIPGFEEQVVGHKTGDEFDVNVKFPKEYHAEELADKDAVFKCKLNSLQYKELPAIDDEFAKDVSEYDTIAELRDSIRKEMQEDADKHAALDTENALVDQVIANMEADIPECMVENRIDELVRDFAMRLEQQGLKLDMYLKYTNSTPAQFREGFKEQADKQVKIRLALEKIAELENITATDDDLEKEIERIADLYKMEKEKVRELIPVEEVKKDLAVNKAIDFVRDNAQITEKTVEADDNK